jgi:hypothetical protein
LIFFAPSTAARHFSFSMATLSARSAASLAPCFFQDLPALRKREAASGVAHYIAGVLDRESMVSIVDSLSRAADLKRGDRVKTFRGTSRGVIVRILADGRVVWRSDASATELTALPESLVRIDS